MTLKQLEKKFPLPSQRPGKLFWELTPDSVSLNWQGEDKAVIDWLLKQAFQVDKRGLISLTGLNAQSMPLINKIHIHQSLTATLLQHNQFVIPITPSYKVSGINLKKITPQYLLNLIIIIPNPWQFYLLIRDKLNSIGSIAFQVDNIQLTLSYKQIISYAHQDFSKELCHPKNHRWLDGYIPIVSWLYPGAIVRHEKIRKYSQCKEQSKYAFALLFLPIACHYLILSKGINEQLKSQNAHPTQYLLVIPDPTNLEKSAQIRWHSNNTKYRNLYVSSLEEAALSLYKQENPKAFVAQRCQVIQYGKLMRTSHLRNPMDIQDFKITPAILKIYQLSCRYLNENKLIKTEINFLVEINLIKGMIADNILNQKSIWSNLGSNLKQKKYSEEIRQQLKDNQQGLFTMIRNNEKITQAHNAFIDVIHEALKIIYAQIYQDNPDAAPKKIDRENESLKSKLINCNKEEIFRHLMAKLLSRAGNITTLSDNRSLVLPILTGKIDWKEARDIALIALSSYPTQARMRRETLVFFTFPLLVDAQLYRLAFVLL